MRIAAEQLALAATALIAASSLLDVNAAPTTASRRSHPQGTDHPLVRRSTPRFHGLQGDELVQWAENHRAGIRAKYASKLKASTHQEERRKRDLEKRREQGMSRRASAGSVSLVNYQQDSSFYAPVYIGTPSQSIYMVLDTGSADMWTVQNSSEWHPSQSSTFQNSTTAFSISYGSGDVAGTLASDTVTLAGQTASQQTFALATSVSTDLLANRVAGIMGLAFKKLSTANAVPFWQNAGADIFSFYLRAASLSHSYSSTLPGGTMTLGGTNTSLYTGDINYSDVIDESYWLITLGGLTASGQDIDLGGMSKVAVDTGTTLIGAPDSVVDQIYQNIAGSEQLSSGYYTFPCSNGDLNATIHFGDQEYLLTGNELVAGTVDSRGTTCLGAFFSFGSTAQDELQYILGDAFLKNVYTIFDNSQSSGARVGFASLADGLGATTVSRTVSQVVAANGASVARVSAVGMAALVVATSLVLSF